MCIGTATFSLINIVEWKIDNNKNSTIIDELQNNSNINSNINFDTLVKYNSDTVGWIIVNNTNINYPFVQTKNNSYYLNHSFNKEENSAGWIFLDYRNDINNLSKNNILYGHSRKDKTMFGSLFNVLEESWYKNENNQIIKVITKNEVTLWQIFSIYIIKNEDYYLTTNFDTRNEFIMYINTSLYRSIYNFNTSVTPDDIILTLSTCNGKYKKLVVQAKLIKKEVSYLE